MINQTNFIKHASVQTPAPTEDKDERQLFINDLTEEERELAVAEYAKRIREQLSAERITVNCMSRLLNVSHPRVSALLAVSKSAKEALLSNTANRVVRAKSLLSKLSDEERALLMEQFKKDNTDNLQ
jgi:hypothetical protein